MNLLFHILGNIFISEISSELTFSSFSLLAVTVRCVAFIWRLVYPFWTHVFELDVHKLCRYHELLIRDTCIYCQQITLCTFYTKDYIIHFIIHIYVIHYKLYIKCSECDKSPRLVYKDMGV
jgi:hypothetical protein